MFSGHSHSFDVGIATDVGINEAIVFNHIFYWIRYNYMKKQNFHEEKTWMFESFQEISDYLGYFSLDQVRRAIEKLVEKGYLIVGNFHKNPMNRTNWYTVYDQNLLFNYKKSSDKGKSLNEQGPSIKMDAANSPCVYEQTNTDNINTEYDNEKKASGIGIGLSKIDSLITKFALKISDNTKAIWKYKFQDQEIINALEILILNLATAENHEAYMEVLLKKKIHKSGSIESFEENKQYAKHASEIFSSHYYVIEALNKFIEVVPKSGQVEPWQLSYSENGFREQLESQLRKLGFIRKQ